MSEKDYNTHRPDKHLLFDGEQKQRVIVLRTLSLGTRKSSYLQDTIVQGLLEAYASRRTRKNKITEFLKPDHTATNLSQLNIIDSFDKKIQMQHWLIFFSPLDLKV